MTLKNRRIFFAITFRSCGALCASAKGNKKKEHERHEQMIKKLSKNFWFRCAPEDLYDVIVKNELNKRQRYFRDNKYSRGAFQMSHWFVEVSFFMVKIEYYRLRSFVLNLYSHFKKKKIYSISNSDDINSEWISW